MVIFAVAAPLWPTVNTADERRFARFAEKRSEFLSCCLINQLALYSSSALPFTCIFLLGLVPTLLLSWAQRRCYAARRCAYFVHMALCPTASSAPAATCILLKPQGFLPHCGFPWHSALALLSSFLLLPNRFLL